MLLESGMSKVFRGEAVNTAAYLINMSPSSSKENKIFEELWRGNISSYSHLKIF